MKKKNIFLIVAVCCVVISICIIVTISNGGNTPSTDRLLIVDSQGETLAILNSDMVIESEHTEYQAYVETVVQEAIGIILEKKKFSQEEAEKELFSGGYTLYTTFDKTAFSASSSAYDNLNLGNTPFAAVVTTHDGSILSIYNGANSDNVNYALEKLPAYSAFKPLSVYAPAFESNAIVWTSKFLDAPIKKVADEKTGELKDWPSNGTGFYENKEISVRMGIKKSLNTTAIRALQKLGVKNSTEFLSEKLGIDLSSEIMAMETIGDEEILGAIGLGYLHTGVTPVDMAGYYQIFVTGGKYTAPFTISSIEKSGKTFYENKKVSKQIISDETAFIMNKLLQTTTERDGTAAQARCDGVKVGGKTGTGSYHLGNWFVGYTPEYICSIWHGRNAKNECTKTFSDVMSGLEHDKEKDFIGCDSILKVPLCKESGQKLTMNCNQMEVGYFKSDNEIETCEIHK